MSKIVVSPKFLLAIKLSIATGERKDMLGGLPVIVSQYLEPDTAALLDENGNIVKIFKLEKA